MGRTVSFAPGYAPEDEFDPLTDDFVAKERKYRHFDLPLSQEQREQLRATGQSINSHAFWPLLAFSKIERRVKRDKAAGLVFSEKVREIKFGSHLDSAILEHYATGLAADYERYLSYSAIDSSVLAYRSGLGNNIDHAASLINEIRERGSTTAIAVDISGFFDNIKHDVLYEQLCAVRKVTRLSSADFKIFQRMTKFEWVDAEAVEECLQTVRRAKGRICDAYQFRKYVRSHASRPVKRNSNFFGIPQGTSLSGLYANISMIGFDEALYKHVGALGGSVRRYSDDVAILVPSEVSANVIIKLVRDELSAIGLSLSEHKTEISQFSIDPSDGTQRADKPFQYLGFTYDGKSTLIRQSSLNRYYSKMRAGVHAKILAAKANDVHPDEIYMRELFRKYTHFGKHRNFPRYVYRAAQRLEAPEIKRQIRNHFEVFKGMVRMAIADIY